MKKFLTFVLVLAMVMSVSSVAYAVDVATISDLTTACATSNNIVLTNDVEIATSIKIVDGVEITLDLNGHKLTGPDDGSANWYAFIIENGGKLTLKDSVGGGVLWAKCYGIETKGGTFVMESGKIDATTNGGIGAAIVNYGGTVIVNGGTLKAAHAAIFAWGYFADAELEVNNVIIEDSAHLDPDELEITIVYDETRGDVEAVIDANAVSANEIYIDSGYLVATVSDDSGEVYAIGKGAIEEAAEEAAKKAGAEKVTVTVNQGDVAFGKDDLPGGVTVKNAGGGDVTVDGKIPDSSFGVVVPTPVPEKPASTGGGYYYVGVRYNGGNSFSTDRSDVPVAVLIDGQPVSFTGNGSNFVVDCINPGASRITIVWNTIKVDARFTPDANAYCTQTVIPKTGGMSIWAAIAQFLGF